MIAASHRQQIVRQVEKKAAASENMDADMLLFARSKLAEMKTSDQTPDHERYIAYVEESAGCMTRQPFSGRSVIIAPMAVFMALMLCITMLGKMATIVNDAVSGSMSFHH